MEVKRNCFNCNNAKPVEIQYPTCICKAGKGTKILNNYWVDAADIKNCDKWEKWIVGLMFSLFRE